MAAQTELGRGDTSSSWEFPRKAICDRRSCRQWSVGKKEREQNENEEVPNKPIQALKQRANSTASRCSSGSSSRHSIKENCSVSRPLIIEEMDSLGCSCSGEAAAGFQPTGRTSQPPGAASVLSRLHVAWPHKTLRSRTNFHSSSVRKWRASVGAV